jgi:hypothetical protein
MINKAGVQLVPPVDAKFLRHYCEMEAMWFVGSKSMVKSLVID